MRYLLALPAVLLACVTIREDPPLPSPSNPTPPGGSNPGGASSGGSSSGGAEEGGSGGSGGETLFVIEDCSCAVALIEQDNAACATCVDADQSDISPDCDNERVACMNSIGCSTLLVPFCEAEEVCVGAMDALGPEDLSLWNDYVVCMCAPTECLAECESITAPDPVCEFTP
jgi:hypothetical protein